MQPVKEVKSWHECKEALRDVKNYRDQLAQREDTTYVDDLLYRGQSDAGWSLTTTLERTTQATVTLPEYYQRIVSAKPEIEAFTDERWDIPELPEYLEKLSRTTPLTPETDIRPYAYMAYLRHHGFPSPLLDWSLSPYVAAFFAFQKADKPDRDCAIYVFLEFAGRGKVSEGNKPAIVGLGRYVRTHRRHFLQQSVYTYSVVKGDGDDNYRFSSHETALGEAPKDQDKMWKITVPASERRSVLTDLRSMNITPFSLFGSEESLMETIALREFLEC